MSAAATAGATAAAGAAAAGATTAMEQAAATEPVEEAVTLLAARIAARLAAGHFTRHSLGDHAGASDHLLAGDAHLAATGSFIGNLLVDAHGVLLDHLLGDALVAADLDLLLANLGPAGRDLADLGAHRAHLAAAGHRALFLNLAAHPHLARHTVGRRAGAAAGLGARIAARIAAVVVRAQAAQAVAEGLPVRILFTALPVAAIDALGDHLGLGDVAVVRLHDGALFDAGHLHADLAALFTPLGHLLVHRATPFPAFLHGAALVGGVLLDALFGFVRDTFDLVRLGDVLGAADRARRWATTARRR